MADEWLSLKQVADELQVSIDTLYRWRMNGTAPVGYRAGRQIRVRRPDLEEWLRTRRDDPVPA